jgi:hypothetical protein
MNNSKTPDTLKEITKRVKEELDEKLLDDFCEFGSETGWSENSLIISGRVKTLVYVVFDENNNIGFDYYDYFPKGEYSLIHDHYMKESLTSHRGFCSSIEELIEELGLDMYLKEV